MKILLSYQKAQEFVYKNARFTAANLDAIRLPYMHIYLTVFLVTHAYIDARWSA